MKKYLVAIITVILIAVIWFAVSNNSNTKPVKIGFIGALSGDIASLGEEAKNSTILASEQIKAKTGHDLSIVYEDGKCSGKDATSAVQKLVDVDKVQVILGGTCSSETLAATPLTEKAGVVLMTSWALNPQITQGNEYVFRNVPSDSQGARSVAELAYKNGARKVAMMTENTDYTKGFDEVFTSAFSSLGGEVVSNEKFNTENSNLKTTVTKVSNVASDAIVVNAQGSNTGIIAKMLSDLKNNKSLYGNIYFVDANVLKNSGQYLEKAYTSEPANLDKTNPKVATFLTAYKERFGSEPQYLFWSAASYDAMNMVADAIQEVGNDGDKIKDYLYGLKSYEGVLGTYDFDKAGDVTGIIYENKQIINKTAQPIK